MNEEIHIGQLIQAKLREDDRSIAWLARKLHCDRTNVYKIFRKQHVEIVQLLQISLILHYDFFAHYSAYVHKHSEM